MKKEKPKRRNPVAAHLRINKPKVIPNKKKTTMWYDPYTDEDVVDDEIYGDEEE